MYGAGDTGGGLIRPALAVGRRGSSLVIGTSCDPYGPPGSGETGLRDWFTGLVRGASSASSSSYSILRVAAVFQDGMAGRASARILAAFFGCPDGASKVAVATPAGGKYPIGACGRYAYCGAGCCGASTYFVFVRRGEGQQALQQAKMPQQHSTPRQQQRNMEKSNDRTMRDPMIIATITGHLEYR